MHAPSTRPSPSARPDRSVRWFRVLALVATAFLASCQARMWRLTPFSGDSSPERVNLWPLAYHDRTGTSVLWPLFDVDRKGFALRPLVAKDGPEWSFLYPWAKFDSRTGEGWAFPYYRFGENAGVFPIANFGQFNFVGPFWWRNDGGGNFETGGLFPLAHFGNTSYIGPVWWTKGGGEYVDGGLFPIATFGRLNHVGPAWWTEGGSFGLFPLFGTGGVHHVGPVWWHRGDDGSWSGGLFPLVKLGSDKSAFSLQPFYSYDSGEDWSRRTFLLGLGHDYRSKEKKERWALPFYYRREEADKKDTVLFPFFWKRTRGDDATVFTPLGHRRVSAESSTFNVYPFWWSDRTEERSSKMLLPFFYYGEKGDDRTLLTPLGGRGWSKSGRTRYTNVLGPLFHRSESANGDRSTAFLWPLFERRQRGEETTTRALPFFSRTTSPRGSESWYALGLGHARETGNGTSRRLWPFYSHTNESSVPSLLYHLTLYGSRESGTTTSRRLFPLFWSRSGESSSSLTYAFGLGSYRKTPGHEAWRLWPFASGTKGDREPGLLDATTLVGSASWRNGESFHVGGPFLYRRWQEEKNGVASRKARYLTFFTHERTRTTQPDVPKSSPFNATNRVRRNEQGFLFGAFLNRRDTYRHWRPDVVTREEANILRSVGRRGGVPSDEDVERAGRILAVRGFETGTDRDSVRRGILDFAETATETTEHRKVRVPFLYGYERTGEKVSWHAPLWLARSKKEPDHTTFSLLYYGYRSETRGDRTTRDIFPFITWDSAPEETTVSFLWRIFRYARKGSRRGGHILFIPWGDA